MYKILKELFIINNEENKKLKKKLKMKKILKNIEQMKEEKCQINEEKYRKEKHRI